MHLFFFPRAFILIKFSFYIYLTKKKNMGNTQAKEDSQVKDVETTPPQCKKEFFVHLKTANGQYLNAENPRKPPTISPEAVTIWHVTIEDVYYGDEFSEVKAFWGFDICIGVKQRKSTRIFISKSYELFHKEWSFANSELDDIVDDVDIKNLLVFTKGFPKKTQSDASSLYYQFHLRNGKFKFEQVDTNNELVFAELPRVTHVLK